MEQEYAATVGFFDGVHIGHVFLLDMLKDIALKRHLKTMAVTFPEHPRQILQSDYRPLLLSTPEDKIEKLSKTGIDNCYPLHFTKELSEMSARDFMLHILKEKLRVRCLLVGHDHHFGHEVGTSIEDYKIIGKELGIEVIGANALIYQGLPISSSRIRRELVKGNIKEANTMLGYCYTINGTVVQGAHIGRKIGFPTANLLPTHKYLQIPADGVYAAKATIEGLSFPAMVNIGFRPTFSDNKTRTIEAHLLDFNENIYSQKVSLQFISYLRAENRFCSPEQLERQLEKDESTIRKELL